MQNEYITRVYPVINDEPEKIYESLSERGFMYKDLEANKLNPPGVGDLVTFEEISSLRNHIIEIAKEYSFHYCPR